MFKDIDERDFAIVLIVVEVYDRSSRELIDLCRKVGVSLKELNDLVGTQYSSIIKLEKCVSSAEDKVLLSAAYCLKKRDGVVFSSKMLNILSAVSIYLSGAYSIDLDLEKKINRIRKYCN